MNNILIIWLDLNKENDMLNINIDLELYWIK